MRKKIPLIILSILFVSMFGTMAYAQSDPGTLGLSEAGGVYASFVITIFGNIASWIGGGATIIGYLKLLMILVLGILLAIPAEYVTKGRAGMTYLLSFLVAIGLTLVTPNAVIGAIASLYGAAVASGFILVLFGALSFGTWKLYNDFNFWWVKLLLAAAWAVFLSLITVVTAGINIPGAFSFLVYLVGISILLILLGSIVVALFSTSGDNEKLRGSNFYNRARSASATKDILGLTGHLDAAIKGLKSQAEIATGHLAGGGTVTDPMPAGTWTKADMTKHVTIPLRLDLARIVAILESEVEKDPKAPPAIVGEAAQIIEAIKTPLPPPPTRNFYGIKMSKSFTQWVNEVHAIWRDPGGTLTTTGAIDKSLNGDPPSHPGLIESLEMLDVKLKEMAAKLSDHKSK